MRSPGEQTHDGDAWEVVVEPDELAREIVVFTAYKVTACFRLRLVSTHAPRGHW